ncbi:hypothetical protein O181_002117 [Austropuccinia psidii MF-1]|uniref:Reverse transcriptase RNase H-like domain-containing protein n=1 Tax=Austropuccinia psidii MF-1 TaxID=1389203 RepID=A0A9Q3GDP2_9BASI|nr:hypothetical protein [Austropuccinia psidii MF-1]
MKHELTNTPFLMLSYFRIPLKLEIDAACNQGLGAALCQRQVLDGEPREGVICYISRKLKDSESRYGSTKTECLCIVWDLGKIHYFLQVKVFKVYTDYTDVIFLLNMKIANGNVLRWKIDMQEYRDNMVIIYKEGKSQTNTGCLRIWPLENVKSNPDYDL